MYRRISIYVSIHHQHQTGKGPSARSQDLSLGLGSKGPGFGFEGQAPSPASAPAPRKSSSTREELYGTSQLIMLRNNGMSHNTNYKSPHVITVVDNCGLLNTWYSPRLPFVPQGASGIHKNSSGLHVTHSGSLVGCQQNNPEGWVRQLKLSPVCDPHCDI